MVDAEIGFSSDLDGIENNLALWLDAKNINGSGNAGLNTGDAILEWKDLSGNNIHVTQTTAASQPTLTSDGINFDLGEHLINSDLITDY